MSLKLQQHQQDAYDNVKKHFEEGDRSIVIFPTGCGKSFVSMKLLEDNRDKKILFVCPSAPIKMQMYEYIVEYLTTDENKREIEAIEQEKGRALNIEEKVKIILPGFKAILYQTMISKKPKTREIIDKLRPDYLICDEVQHVKYVDNEGEDELEQGESSELRNIWGASVNEFAEKNPGMKILGITATPERSDGVNVAIDFFKGKIASEISLIDALTSDTIPVKAPDYVSCIYTLLNELDEKSIQEQLELYRKTNPRKAEELQRKLDEIRAVAGEGKGIRDLFREHLTTPEAKSMGRDTGKYIVFCSSIEDMKQKMEEAKEWFADIDSEPEIYAVSSKYNVTHGGESAREVSGDSVISDFEKSKSNHVKLLFSVNMLNEGLHVHDVTGVIMTRKTNSRTIYLQQLGRAISSNPDRKKPIVFDIANNYINYNIYEELRKSRSTIRGDGERENNQEQEEIDNESDADTNDWIEPFKIKGIMKDLTDLLDEQRRNANAIEHFIEKLSILKKHGIDTSNIRKSDTIKKVAQRCGLENLSVLENDGLDLNYGIGVAQVNVIQSCRGNGEGVRPTEEQIQILREIYGIQIDKIERDTNQEFIDRLFILREHGIDTSRIGNHDTVRSMAERDGIQDLEALENDGLDIDFSMGSAKNNLIGRYRGRIRGAKPSEEQVRILQEEFGISLERQDRNIIQEFIDKLYILKKHGIVVSKMRGNDTIRTLAKRCKFTNLENLEAEGLNLDDTINRTKVRISMIYQGKAAGQKPTEEQVRILRDVFKISLETGDKNITQKFINKLQILKMFGIDTSDINASDTIKTVVERNGFTDFEKLEEEGLDLDDKIGFQKNTIITNYRGKGKGVKPTEEQIRILLEIYGISLDEQKKKSKKEKQEKTKEPKEKKLRDLAQELIDKLEILKRHGVDTSLIKKGDTIKTLAERSGITNFEELLNEGIDLQESIISRRDVVAKVHRGLTRGKKPTEEQIKILKDEYGITLDKQNRDTIQEFIDKLELFKQLGIDTSDIRDKDTIRILAERYGVDIELLKEKGFDLDEKIGGKKSGIAKAYRGHGRGAKPSEEQVRILEEEYGILLKKRNKVQEYISKLEILKRHGVDCSKIYYKDTVRSLAEREGITDLQVLVEDGLDLDFKLAEALEHIKRDYRGKGLGIKPTEEQVRVLWEEYGVSLEYKNISSEDIGQTTYVASADECDKAFEVIEEITRDRDEQKDQSDGDISE